MYTIGQWFRKHFNQKRLKANPNRNNHLRVYSGHFLSKKVTICFWLIAWLVVYFSGLFTVSRPYMVQFSEIENPTVRFGAVLRKRKSYGAVCCGFEKHEILRCCSVLWYILRCGSARFPVERFFYGAAPLPVGKTHNTVFSLWYTVRINRTKTSVLYGFRAFSREARTKPLFFFYCFSTMHRMNKSYKPAGRCVGFSGVLLFLGKISNKSDRKEAQ